MAMHNIYQHPYNNIQRERNFIINYTEMVIFHTKTNEGDLPKKMMEVEEEEENENELPAAYDGF